jgi:hypothetical protein
MNQLIKCPAWAFQLFAGLCFSHVKEQLPENLYYYSVNPPSFMYADELFVFTETASVVTGECKLLYGASVN